ncbi:Outer membrane protein assembly factor BamA precursor [Candidatus Fokinia solitaria]|uniref:Outer membrane protein assembly factor BamA n=1 Tax=Candidatus Fokinia solitaria TaxID=1802984 RepID=A0A2U8BSJ7_9RICK|nr:outer membrane protein assembly factor BamA [Candidatus Fokinia solitaria]AWD33307.1 Outer membrane protein assembly factor BamA precursor [Candidatus Fokinia solitaria]
MRYFKRFTLLLLLFLFLGVCYDADAATGGTVIFTEDVKLTVAGNKMLSSSAIIHYFALPKRKEITEQLINNSIKKLYGTGFFKEVRAEFDEKEHSISIKVKEVPIVNAVFFRGNKNISDSTLQNFVKMKPGTLYGYQKSWMDSQVLKQVFREKGYFEATITPKFVMLDDVRVNVIYYIYEGNAPSVVAINFVENKAFSDAKLKDVLSMKEKTWYRALGSSHIVKHSTMVSDIQRLKEFYEDAGYIDCEVSNGEVAILPEKKGALVTYVVDEGARYIIRNMTVNLEKKVNFSDVIKKINIRRGDPVSIGKIKGLQEALKEKMHEAGYAFSKVSYEITKDGYEVDVRFNITESSYVYVDNIVIDGNSKTKDFVVRKELEIMEGDPFKMEYVNASLSNIRALDIFDDINVSVVPQQNDRADLKLTVKEKSTAKVQLQVAYGGMDSTGKSKFSGLLELVERNFLGTGKIVDVRFSAGPAPGMMNNTANVAPSFATDFTYTDPYFLERDLKWQFGAFYNTTPYYTENANTKQAQYDIVRKGLFTKFIFPMTKNCDVGLGYTVRGDDINNKKSDVSAYIRAEQSPYVISAVTSSITYNKVFYRGKLPNGYSIGLFPEFAGLGGNGYYQKYDVSANFYLPTADRSLLIYTKLNGGLIEGFGDNKVSVVNGFMLGAPKVRGFQPNGIGPRDKLYSDSLGAKKYFTTSVELIYPLKIAKELDIDVRGFVDFGTCWDIDIPKKTWEKMGYYPYNGKVPDEAQMREEVQGCGKELSTFKKAKEKAAEQPCRGGPLALKKAAEEAQTCNAAQLSPECIESLKNPYFVQGLNPYNGYYNFEAVRGGIGVGLSIKLPFLGTISFDYAIPINPQTGDLEQRFFIYGSAAY